MSIEITVSNDALPGGRIKQKKIILQFRYKKKTYIHNISGALKYIEYNLDKLPNILKFKFTIFYV
jgi:hypothetical protein